MAMKDLSWAEVREARNGTSHKNRFVLSLRRVFVSSRETFFRAVKPPRWPARA